MGIYQTLSDLGLVAGPLFMGVAVEVFGFATALTANALLAIAIGLAFWSQTDSSRLSMSPVNDSYTRTIE